MSEQLEQYLGKECKVFLKQKLYYQGKITDFGTLFLTVEDRHKGPTMIALTEISEIREVGE